MHQDSCKLCWGGGEQKSEPCKGFGEEKSESCVFGEVCGGIDCFKIV